MFVGNEGILFTAFFTSESAASILYPLSTSINIFAEFSFEVEVKRSIPTIPLRLSSIFKMMPSSISWGEAPGYITLIEIFLFSINGKKDDFKLLTPAKPNTVKAITINQPAIG